MKNIVYFPTIISLLLALVGMLGCRKDEGLKKQEISEYFPVEEGREWKYNMHVPKGSYMLTLQYADEDGGLWAKRGRHELTKEDHLLHIAISTQENTRMPPTSRGLKTGWVIEVKSDSTGLLYPTERWDRVYWATDGTVWFEVHKYGPGIGERPIELEPLFPSYRGPGSERRLGTWSLETPAESITGEFVKLETVSVPAGTFKNCISIARIVKASANAEEGKPSSPGWMSISYYGQNVGLLKRIQFDRAGSVLNTMELIEYKVSEAKTNDTPKQFRIHVDSVPSGAEVILREQPNGEEKLLGKTPLNTNIPNAKSQLWVKMSVEDLVKSFDKIPGLKEWKDRLRSWDNVTYHPFVSFYRTGWAVIQARPPVDGPPGMVTSRVLEAGPYIEIDPTSRKPEISRGRNRECVLFLPVGEKVSVLFPIMPPRKTFRFDEDGMRPSLMKEYMFSEQQAAEAVESLSRCGKAYTTVKGPVAFPSERRIGALAKDEEMDFAITMLPDDKGTYIVEWESRRLLSSTKEK